MSKLLTVGEAVQVLARATGRDPGPLARQIRGWLQQKIVEPTARGEQGPAGRVPPALFDAAGVCRLRVLMALYGSAVVFSSNTDDAGGSIDRKLASYQRNDGEREYSFREAVTASDDARWAVRVYRIWDRLERRHGFYVEWLRNGESGRRDEADGCELFVIGSDIEAVTEVPFSDLVGPILAELSA